MRSTTPVASAVRRRPAFSYRGLLIALPVALAVPALAWSVLPGLSWTSEDVGPMTHTVRRGEFIHEITERGAVESASNVEIRCEVQSQSSGGTMLLTIAPEGTRVQAGDVLATLDSSSLEDRLTQQQIVCNSSYASLIQAQTALATAEIARTEYLEGTYKQSQLELNGRIFKAQQNLRQAQQLLEYSQGMVDKRYKTQLQLEADQFEFENAEKELALARNELEVLEKYSKDKEVKQLDSDIETAKARLESEEHSYELDQDKLTLIEDQIEACQIKAPKPGQVVYANVTDRRGGSEIIIEEGMMVRERQVIIRLPDPDQMQVKAKVNEAKISMVAEGQPATIRLDAFTDLELSGIVIKVNEYPAPTSYSASAMKEYETTVKINETPPGLRPGLTAEVKIRLQTFPDVVQVPVQTIFEHRGKHYCVFYNNRQYSKKEVKIGPTNDKFVVVKEGLEPGEKIVLAAAANRDKVLTAKEKELLYASEEPGATGQDATGEESSETQGDGPASGQGRTPGGESTGGRAAAGGPRPGGPGGGDPNQAFQRFDANGDGKLDADEIPAPMQAMTSAADSNADGAIDRAEWAAFARQRASRGGQGGDRRPRGDGAELRRPGGDGGAAGRPGGDGNRRPGGGS